MNLRVALMLCFTLFLSSYTWATQCFETFEGLCFDYQTSEHFDAPIRAGRKKTGAMVNVCFNESIAIRNQTPYRVRLGYTMPVCFGPAIKDCTNGIFSYQVPYKNNCIQGKLNVQAGEYVFSVIVTRSDGVTETKKFETSIACKGC